MPAIIPIPFFIALIIPTLASLYPLLSLEGKKILKNSTPEIKSAWNGLNYLSVYAINN